MPCPLCKSETQTVLYGPFPMRLCKDESCTCLFGFWMWVFWIWPFTGFLAAYDCGYLTALWYVLIGKEQE